MNGRPWGPQDDAKMRTLYPDLPTVEVARRLNRSVSAIYGRADKLGLEKSAAYRASPAACRTNGRQGMGTRFQKGHVPANKGLRRPGYAPGRMRETQFKAGQRGSRWMPIGSTRLIDGYQYTKISDVRSTKGGRGFVPYTVNWKPTHILLWEKKYGPVPDGQAVRFKNGDRTDIRLENLELISRGELMRRNTLHNLPKPLAQTYQLIGALNRKINRKAKAGTP